MAVLEAQIRASISNATSMFAAAPPTVPPAVAAGVAAASAGPAANGNGAVSSLPKKAQDHTLRCVRAVMSHLFSRPWAKSVSGRQHLCSGIGSGIGSGPGSASAVLRLFWAAAVAEPDGLFCRWR